MSAVSHTRPHSLRRLRAARVVSAGLVALAIGGLIAVGPQQEPAADAAASTSSAITVAWNDDTSTAKQFQPPRSTTSPHFADFAGIKITVSQTTGIIDQAVRVNVTGFSPTISSYSTALPLNNARNYLQAMQCWGPNPLADDFNETCQWGGRYRVENSGLGNSVYSDTAARTGPLDFDSANPTTHDVPFRTSGGTEISGKIKLVGGNEKYPILDYFGPSTTNEVTSARVGAGGAGFFDFETQSADQAPQLSCGGDQTRCWLVVVPRGSHFGGDGEECSGIRDPANRDELYTYGQAKAIQGGSPVNDLCDYWDNRIVVPLDFAPTGSKCAVGSTETRVIGSQLMIGAMSSWQPELCQNVKSTFSFSTNPDSVARAQLIETGANTAGIAYTGYPVSSGELLQDYERETLAKTKLTYAPVAVSGVVIAFFAESADGRQEQLVLSPRLMAKFLTQSYPFSVPQSQSNIAQNADHLAAVNRTYTYWNKDPEFQALNPTNYLQFPYAPSLILPGPSGADGIRQVWRWIMADKKAVAFLNGDADDWGMKVNPYYLPKNDKAAVVPWHLDESKNYLSTAVPRQVGMTNLDGTPQKLSSLALDTFPRNDETLMPLQLFNGERSRFDSIQFSPYAETFLSAARQTFRADPNSKTFWNTEKFDASGQKGDWTSAGSQLPGQKFTLAITDTVSAERWGLSTATVLGAGSTIGTKATTETMAVALDALEATSLDSVKQVNPATVPTGGYPMTIVTYAAVNLTKSTAATRATISSMLTQVTTTGQEPGSGIGQLPAGYLPLTAELKAKAAVSAAEVKNFQPETTGNTTSDNYAQDDYNPASAGSGENGPLGGQTDPTVTEGVDALTDGRTAAAAFTEPITRSGLAVALVVGLLGFIVAPILFRGRGFR